MKDKEREDKEGVGSVASVCSMDATGFSEEGAEYLAEDKSLEDVARSVKSVVEAKRKKRRRWYVVALMVLFFPITLLYKLVLKGKRFKLTVKTTVYFTVICLLLIGASMLFMLLSVEKQLKAGRSDAAVLRTLKLTGIILLVIFVTVAAILGNIIAKATMVPIKRVSDEIKGIDGSDLGKRVESVNRQEELVGLVKEINRLMDSLQGAFERQNNFISDASHELKTPLAVINGYAELLKRWGKEDSAILDEGIEAIAREAKFMEKLIKQLLLLAQLGQLNASPSRFDLGTLVEETVESYRVLDVPHILDCSCEKVSVYYDKGLITEAVRTLIDNAIKYTSPEGGRIWVTVRSNAETAFVTVRDNGCGIAREEQERIFDRFYLCDKTRGREKGSSGLGLSICKSIVELSGGEITVRSELSKGSEFTVALPKKHQ